VYKRSILFDFFVIDGEKKCFIALTPGELDVSGGHAQVFAPHVGEDVLELVAVNNTHVNLV
jgi:hypothetical protein